MAWGHRNFKILVPTFINILTFMGKANLTLKSFFLLHSLFIYISYFPFLCIYTAQLNLPWAVSDQIVCQILDCLPQNIVYSVTSCFRIVNSVTRCFRIVYSFTRCVRKEYLLGKNKMTEPQTSEHTMANLRQYQNYINKNK